MRWDALNEFISIDTARNIYGVVLNPKTFEIDYMATEELRKRLKAEKIKDKHLRP